MKFYKYSGLGNDFLLIEGNPLPSNSIISLCNRHDGIGADGIIFYQIHQKISAQFYNSDGSNPSLCGNGLRSLFHNLHRLGKMNREGDVTIGDHTYQGVIKENCVAVELGIPQCIKQNYSLEIEGESYQVDLINTGVPHFVVKEPSFPFDSNAKILRFHPLADPHGANVNLLIGNKVRTYERGCEEETFACGTGIAACAYSMHLQQKIPFPITLLTVKERPLTVDLKNNSLWIEGPATFIFQGEIDLDIISDLNR